jgi:hypothetical protein
VPSPTSTAAAATSATATTTFTVDANVTDTAGDTFSLHAVAPVTVTG